MASASSGIEESVPDSETVNACLSLLKESTDDVHYKQSIDTLIKIFRNTVIHPGEEKYRRLKKSNKTFHEKVWQYDGATQLMLSAGWVEVDDCVVLPADVHLANILEMLVEEHRSLEPPAVVEQPTESDSMTKKREAMDREKRLHDEEIRREKAERKRIRDQILADRRETNTRESRASHATHFSNDGHMTRFGDIGVDLSKGGG